METVDVLVVGAGLAGVSAAADLSRSDMRVLVLDKGRALGGRAATRRFGGQPIDHGAQFCTARTTRLQDLLEDGQRSGWARVWCHGYPLWKDGEILHRADSHPRWIFPEGMRTLAERIGAGLDVRTSTKAESLQRTNDDLWEVATENGEKFRASAVVLNLPPVQLLSLAGEQLAPEHRDRIAAAELAPCWALSGLVESDFADDWVALELENHPVLAWVARDHTRRDGPAHPAAVLHARGDWSRTHLEAPEETVRSRMEAAASELFNVRFTPESRLHRWRYAKPETSIGDAFLFDSERRIGVCGDWCAGGRVEGALVSGWELAASIVPRQA